MSTSEPIHLALAAGVLGALAVSQGPATKPRTGTLTDGREFAPAAFGLDAAKLDAAVGIPRTAVEQEQLRGAVALIARHGRIVALEAFGWRDLAGKRAMQTNTLFRMASNTKLITAAAIAALVDDGKLSYDGLVHEVFPTFASEQAKQISLHHLLTHESGLRIPSLFVKPLMRPSKHYPDAPNLVLEVARIGRVGPAVEPGTTFRYSNPGYNTLAGIVERVAKQPFAAFAKKRFYEPMGMTDTCHHESVADPQRMSSVFSRRLDEQRSWRARWRPGDPPTLPFVRGSGGMISTARDHAAFYQMLLNGGTYDGKRILSEDAVRRMTSQQAKHGAGSNRYGYGLVVAPNNSSPHAGSFWHSGSDGTYAWASPKHQLIGLLLTQSPVQESKAIRLAFRNAVVAAITDQ